MAVTSRDIRSTTPRRPMVALSGGSVSMIAYAVTALLALLAIYAVLSTLISWGQTRFDDLRYLPTRTYHLSAMVGHEGETGQATRFVAMNLDRQVVILFIPGGDSSKVQSLPAPYLVGAGEDRTPVTLRLADVNQDQRLDLVAQIKNEEMVYLNRAEGFTLMTAEERRSLQARP